MEIPRQPLRMVRGDTVVMRLTVVDEKGELQNLTGSTIHFRIKKSVASSRIEVLKSSADASEIDLLPQSGDTFAQADIFLDPADTAGLDPGKHFYDVWVEDLPGVADDNVLIRPSPIFIERAVTELSIPAPPPPGPPGPSLIGIYTRGHKETIAVGSATTETSLGIVAFPGSVLAVSALLGEAVTAGSVTVNVKVAGIVVLSIVLDLTNPLKLSSPQAFGVDTFAVDDEIAVEVITAGYDNAGSIPSGLTVNVYLGT
ncbi:hypothetical protein LCGC14_0750300 [marine sediment metagenome]|uniref:Uncharacterized protein n=1 Tax=marine sediment metagenome TaxID=412755 RepID=A0A0F9QP52_9ZZZZ